MKTLILIFCTLFSSTGEPYADIRIKYENKEHSLEDFKSELSKSIRKEDNLAEYIDYTLAYASKYKIDPVLILSIIWVESNFNNRAVSGAGAVGPMQLMKVAVKHVETLPDINTRHIDRTAIKYNIKYGTRYIRVLLKKFHNNLPMVIVAYNMGPAWVLKKNNQHKLLTHKYYLSVVRKYNLIRSRLYVKSSSNMMSQTTPSMHLIAEVD
jgi:soluble lytic murein transglycosylase-like protein